MVVEEVPTHPAVAGIRKVLVARAAVATPNQAVAVGQAHRIQVVSDDSAWIPLCWCCVLMLS
jgi:hypothetical protein